MKRIKLNYFFIILLLLTLNINAYSNDFRIIRAQAVLDGNIVKIKVQIKSNMIDKDTALRKRIRPEYISHVTAKVNNKTIYDIATSAYLNKTPLLSFQYKSHAKNDIIEFFITDNNGKQIKQSIQVDHSKRKQTITKPENIYFLTDSNLTKPKLWEATTTKEAINELYGSITPINGHIKLTVPSLVANHRDVPIHIQSNENLESFAIFIDKNPRPTIAVVTNPLDGIIDYKFLLRMVTTLDDVYYPITIIGKGRDGKFYQVKDVLNLPCSMDEKI
ncbi:thiosulfate oxidation carrier complex protein SoxZ [Sulfurovum sp. TSL1]|uniref:thiosulfate oxidation carrier complex protein SoxZ n=1 Tax=Sulfurovum sp. TSL1 TaxID=2826994 RepID=UPI001CC71B0F|nr:thiosulfate oxidation carrier complex protein SoxZ [Sulfurovum sp. TSL1]GIT97702.1 hypothetical protein TSL1_05230 [Sulfurovum sp. TSL1]